MLLGQYGPYFTRKIRPIQEIVLNFFLSFLISSVLIYVMLTFHCSDKMPEIIGFKEAKFMLARDLRSSIHGGLAVLLLGLWWGRPSWQWEHCSPRSRQEGDQRKEVAEKGEGGGRRGAAGGDIMME